jgi:hypothetical protein
MMIIDIDQNAREFTEYYDYRNIIQLKTIENILATGAL